MDTIFHLPIIYKIDLHLLSILKENDFIKCKLEYMHGIY